MTEMYVFFFNEVLTLISEVLSGPFWNKINSEVFQEAF